MKDEIALLLCIGLVCSPVFYWGHFKGSVERTGSSNTPAPDTPYLLWEIDLGSDLYSSPVEKNGMVFQVALEELVCVDLESGNIVWKSPVPAYHSTPALTFDKIIVATNRGVSALSMKDGDDIWEYVVAGRFSTYPLDDYIVSSPAVSEGKVVIGTRPYSRKMIDPPPNDWDDLYLICLDEANEKEQWYVKTTLGVYSSPCISEGKVFAASREMLCIDSKTGRVEWNSEYTHPYDSEQPKNERYSFDDSTPALYHGVLIGGSSVMGWSLVEPRFEGYHKIVAMDQYTGDILWEWIEEGALASSPAVHGGSIYFYSFDGMVRCLSLLDGEELWETPISEPREFEIKGFRLWPSPSVTDGKVYIGSIEGVVHCLDAHTGEKLWKYKTGGPIHSTPALAWGKVLISSTDGKLYCFAIDPGTYTARAEEYYEEKDYGRAEEFLIAAKEHAKNKEDMKEINRLLSRIKSKEKEYKERLDRLSKAETLMDEADAILWDNKYVEARELYRKAYRIFDELDDEFGKNFCMNRITYIQNMIPEKDQRSESVWQLGFSICAIAFVFLLLKWVNSRGT